MRRNYDRTPQYQCRLNRAYPKESDVIEYLDTEIERSKSEGGAGFRDVLVRMAQREMRRKAPVENITAEARLERLLVRVLNQRMDELVALVGQRAARAGDVTRTEDTLFTADDVTGMIDDADIRSLIEELNGEFGD